MAKESKIVIFHGKVLFFIVKKIRNYDCGPWLLYDLAEESKRCFTKKRRTTLPKNLFALISSGCTRTGCTQRYESYRSCTFLLCIKYFWILSCNKRFDLRCKYTRHKKYINIVYYRMGVER